MAVKERSFWSTTSGVATGVAGTLTGIVGIVTLAAQMGWIGGGDSNDNDPTSVQSGSEVATTVAPGGSRGTTAGAPNQGTATPLFSLQPTSLSFDNLGERKKTVTVLNEGSSPMSVRAPKVEGTDAARFSATAPTCTGRDVTAKRSCEVEVTFSPNRSGSYKATLVVEVVGGSRPQEVSLTGQSLL